MRMVRRAWGLVLVLLLAACGEKDQPPRTGRIKVPPQQSQQPAAKRESPAPAPVEPPQDWTVRVVGLRGRPAKGSLSVVGYLERHELELDARGDTSLDDVDIHWIERYRIFARRGKLCTRLVKAPAKNTGKLLRMEEGGVFEARVRDSAGDPVAGVDVAFLAADVPSGTPPLFLARTGKDGTARIEGLPLETPLRVVVPGFRGGTLLGRLNVHEPRRWSEPGEVQTGEVLFDPPTGRVVCYWTECPEPEAEFPCKLLIRAAGDEESYFGSHPVRELPCDVSIFVPKDCPPLVFRLGVIGEQRGTDMEPNDGALRKRLVLREEAKIIVRARDGAGRPLASGSWHVRVWFLENGETKRYPRESRASAGDGLHVVKLPWPRELLAMKRYALRFEVRAGQPRSECYPYMPSEQEALTIPAPELLRRLEAGGEWHVDLTAKVARKPVFLARNGNNDPVDDVEIELHGEEGVIFKTRSGADGLARCDGLPKGKVPLAAFAKPPWFGRVFSGGAGFRGSRPIPLVVHRTRPFTLTVRTPVGPVEEGTEIAVSGLMDQRFSWDASAETDETGKVELLVPLAVGRMLVEVSDYSQSIEQPLQPGHNATTIDLLPRVKVKVTTTGAGEGKTLHVDVTDPRTGDELQVGTSTSSDEPGVVRVTLPVRPLRIAACEAYVDDGRIGVAEWDGKATELTVALREPPLHGLRLEFVDEIGRPLPKLKIRGEWSGEGRFGSLDAVTDEQGAHTVSVVPGWVRVTVFYAGRKELAPPGELRLRATRDSSLRVTMRWWQHVHIMLSAGADLDDFAGSIAWRKDKGAWTAIGGVPWRRETDPAGRTTTGFLSGTGAGRIELRIRGQVHGFDYPGEPVDPPVFRLR